MVIKKEKDGILFKIDFEKVYDSIRWDFFDYTMERMGFGRKWRVWIMICVFIISMLILVNGIFIKFFNMEKGL